MRSVDIQSIRHECQRILAYTENLSNAALRRDTSLGDAVYLRIQRLHELAFASLNPYEDKSVLAPGPESPLFIQIEAVEAPAVMVHTPVPQPAAHVSFVAPAQPVSAKAEPTIPEPVIPEPVMSEPAMPEPLPEPVRFEPAQTDLCEDKSKALQAGIDQLRAELSIAQSKIIELESNRTLASHGHPRLAVAPQRPAPEPVAPQPVQAVEPEEPNLPDPAAVEPATLGVHLKVVPPQNHPASHKAIDEESMTFLGLARK